MAVHGLLLTGGTSRRMIVDKATVRFGSTTLAAHAARALVAVADPVLAVGHEAGTDLPTVEDPKRGPLVAFVAGADALEARGATGPIVLLGCDLPLMTANLLQHIVDARGDADASIPVVEGREQPMVACYGPGAVIEARRLVDGGETAMHRLLAHIEVHEVLDWHDIAAPEVLIDVDTPEELEDARHHAGHP